MIGSFKDRRTENLYHGRISSRVRRIPTDVRISALREMDMIHASVALNDLRTPPGNRLEALRGNLTGFHSIRINDQWRIIFRWEAQEAFDLEIIDYH